VLDLIGQLALALEIRAIGCAAGTLDQRVDPLHRVLDFLIVKVRADDVQNFVIPQRGTSFLWVQAPVER